MLYYNNFTPTNSMERRERELASIELDPVVFLEAMSKPADSEPQTAKARHIMRHGCCIFEVARFGAEVVHLRRNTGIYHNPKRQRGIYGKPAQNAKARSLADAAGWDDHKRATSKRTHDGVS
jgi:hypothetical protein